MKSIEQNPVDGKAEGTPRAPQPSNVTSLEDARRLRAGRDYVTAETFTETAGHLTADAYRHVSDAIAYDEFKRRVVCRKKLPFKNIPAGDWEEIHSIALHYWLGLPDGGKLKVSLSHVDKAAQLIARMNAFHPVLEYLDQLPEWDGAPRIDTWLTECFGAEDTPLTRAYAAKTLIAAVARVKKPGCKVDTVLVLESEQGKRKSATLQALCSDPSWFVDSKLDITDTAKAGQVTVGKWIVEFSELESMKGRDKSTVRAWLSSSVDDYRKAYGRESSAVPRQFIIIGTTNESEYLEEFERRIWSVACSSRSNTEWVTENREQLWAEALKRYNSGEQWWLSEELEKLARESCSQRVVTDEWVSIVGAWVSKREELLRTEAFKGNGITTAQVLLEALSLQPKDMGRSQNKRCGEVLRKLGFVAKKRNAGMFYFLKGRGAQCAHGRYADESCPVCRP